VIRHKVDLSQLLDKMKLKEMKNISILIIAICFGGILKAQQLPQITQYTFNDYAINPAIAGMKDYYQLKTIVRNQWVGITDAPRTTILSFYGRKSEHVGLGGLVFNDETGPTSRIGGSASYTYSFPLSKKVNLSLALSAGFTQFKITKQGLNLENQNDPYMQGGDVVRSAPDATFGFNLYGKKWYIGGSIPQLLNSKINLIDPNFARLYNLESKGNLVNHFYVLGAYKHDVNPDWSIEPSVLLKTVSAAPMQYDFGVKTTYDNRIWLGLDYRNNGDMSALLGYAIQEIFMIGYSYGIINTDLSSYTSGSHEFMFGIRMKVD